MNSVLGGIVPRRLCQVLLDRLSEAPVVMINGPRTAGKSTLLAEVAGQLRADVIDLDDPPTRDAVADDPSFFASAPAPVLVDEYQHVPDLLNAIKAELNRSLRPGRFVLTGSTEYGSLPQVARALTGRVHVLNLLPLSQGEIAGTSETFVDRLLERPTALVQHQPSTTTREEYAARVVAGGYPIALRSVSRAARNRWMRDYVELVVTRDVVELSRIRQRAQLPRLLRQLASQTGQVLNVAKAAREASIDPSTAERYTALMEAVFLVRRLDAWGTTLGARVRNAPKIHLVDSGLGAWLLGINEERLLGRDPATLTEFGHLLETFVVGEIMKHLSWSERMVEAGHLRTRDGAEVDLVLEVDTGEVAMIEVKASSRVSGDDFRSLRLMRDKLGGRFVGGAVLYLGQRSYSFEDRLYVLPVDMLWDARAD